MTSNFKGDYFHPFFTYYTERTLMYGQFPYSLFIEKDQFRHYKLPPYIINEAVVNNNFFGKIVRLPTDVIPKFLEYQYNAYLHRLYPGIDPVKFLEYLEIEWVEWVYWQQGDYDKIMAMLDWLRHHPYYEYAFPNGEPQVERENIYVSFPKSFSADNTKYETPRQKLTDPNLENHKALAREFLHFLSGKNPEGQKIMSDADFSRMVEYTDQLIEQETIPQNLIPIHHINIPQYHLRYTYYLIHLELYGRGRKRKYFVEFLHALFPVKFEGSSFETTFNNFSVKPGSYDQDTQKD